MEDQGLLQQGIDIGDELTIFDDFYNNCQPSVVGMGTPNSRGQTAITGVSAANDGGYVGSGPCPPMKEESLANEQQMFWHGLPAANAYTQDLGENGFGHHQQQQPPFPYGFYNSVPLDQQSGCLDYPGSLPSSSIDSGTYGNMPVFGEPADYGHVSPSTVNSSFSSSTGSSIDSSRMASMTLNSLPAQASMRLTPAPEGQAWVSSNPTTISPKMLRINPSPTPTSSSESAQTNILTSGDSDLSSFERKHACGTSKRPSKPRKELPSKPSKPRTRTGTLQPCEPSPSSLSVPVTTSTSSSSLKGKAPMTAREPGHRHRHSQHHHHQHHNHHGGGRSSGFATLSPMPEGELFGRPAFERSTTDAERAAKDELLVRRKEEGVSYRQIREEGGFTEAESTLRGRYRTLTKSREERVRKPEWQDRDIRLLKKAVREKGVVSATKSSKNAEQSWPPTKISWKEVGKYIKENGGSYHFGNATCRKKWDELVSKGKTGR
ncbi:hypothetical protein F5Y15DRAFT_428000 [Xylariaceae sp. FL0016]|nr:hypothetical protein F5Y15DRAFT_428000 [Xylariaceae sp. FL0016]